MYVRERFSEGSSLWHIDKGYDDDLVFACYHNITLSAAYFSSCFVPPFTKYPLQTPDKILK